MSFFQSVRSLLYKEESRQGRHLTAKEAEAGEAGDQAQGPCLGCVSLLLGGTKELAQKLPVTYPETQLSCLGLLR